MENWMNRMQEYDKRIGVPQFEGWQEREIEAHKKAQTEQLILRNVVGQSEQLICPICGLDGFEDQADLDIHLEDCED